MDRISDFYPVFYVDRNGLFDFAVIKAVGLKDSFDVSKSFAKASECRILGVCFDCFKTFRLCNDK